jgi:hypothetical protein
MSGSLRFASTKAEDSRRVERQRRTSGPRFSSAGANPATSFTNATIWYRAEAEGRVLTLLCLDAPELPVAVPFAAEGCAPRSDVEFVLLSPARQKHCCSLSFNPKGSKASATKNPANAFLRSRARFPPSAHHSGDTGRRRPGSHPTERTSFRMAALASPATLPRMNNAMAESQPRTSLTATTAPVTIPCYPGHPSPSECRPK